MLGKNPYVECDNCIVSVTELNEPTALVTTSIEVLWNADLLEGTKLLKYASDFFFNVIRVQFSHEEGSVHPGLFYSNLSTVNP